MIQRPWHRDPMTGVVLCLPAIALFQVLGNTATVAPWLAWTFLSLATALVVGAVVLIVRSLTWRRP